MKNRDTSLNRFLLTGLFFVLILLAILVAGALKKGMGF